MIDQNKIFLYLCKLDEKLSSNWELIPHAVQMRLAAVAQTRDYESRLRNMIMVLNDVTLEKSSLGGTVENPELVYEKIEPTVVGATLYLEKSGVE